MLFIANWKMNKSFDDACAFITNHKTALETVSSDQKQIIICPSFPALFPIAQTLKNSSIQLGSQNCSAYEKGAYTGQVSAQSLKQVGCQYSIIGHSESRAHNHESNELIAQKLDQLIMQQITPIVCIGESQQEYEQKKTFDLLAAQLALIMSQLKTVSSIISYEPIWAIGTGVIPDTAHLANVFSWLHNQKSSTMQLIYGGSVDETNVQQLAQIEGIDGFLIGGASLDFPKLEKIVSLG